METEKESNGGRRKSVTSAEVEITPLKSTEEVEKPSSDNDLVFPVDSIPPWYITLIYAFQQVMNVISGPVAVSFIIQHTVCAQNDPTFLAELIGTSVFMNGLCTLLQVTFGIRLPVVQGSSFVYVPVLTSLMSTPQWRCPEIISNGGANETAEDWNDAVGWNSSRPEEVEALWKPRMREVSGALIVVSSVQVLLGCTGLVGVLMHFIGPLTIAPAISLIGLSLRDVVSRYCSRHWGVSLSTAAVFVLVSQLLKNVQVPIPAYNRSRGFHVVSHPIFRLFPPMIAIAFGWILCLILTLTGKLPNDPSSPAYRARTDAGSKSIVNSNWIFFPYPGMWGLPTFSASVLVGMSSATLCTVVESIGDYYATARACRVTTPPRHAVNRGIAMEGFGSVICGLLGAGHATTTYSQTIGFVPLTGMGSRVTWQVAGLLLMAAGIFGKFGAAVATIPLPVLGGVMLVCVGMVVSVGLSNIQFVDLGTGRNMMILGTSLLLGLVISEWVLDNASLIDSGNSQIDQMLTILFGSPMFVGGSVGCLLDNIIPGTPEERGMTAFHQPHKKNDEDGKDSECDQDVYRLPFTDFCGCAKWRLWTFLPFLPCYKPRSLRLRQRFRLFRKK